MILSKKLLLTLISEEIEKAEAAKGGKELLDALIAVLAAAEDADVVTDEGRSSRRRRHKKRSEAEKVAELKARAGIPQDIKTSKFTDEQKRLYAAAKEQMKLDKIASAEVFTLNLLHGDLLELPLVKQLAKNNPRIAFFVKSWVSGGKEINLTNLVKSYEFALQTGE